MSDTADPNAGEVLSILMERAHVSNERLAEIVGYSKQTIYNKLRGQAWKNTDSRTFAQAFNVPADIFLKEPVAAMLWLIDNGRFNLEVIDLRDASVQRPSGFPWNADGRPRVLVSVGD